MPDEARTPVVQACAYAALVLVSLAIALDAPEQLMGPPDFQALPYAACFIGAVWLSSFLISSPWKLSLTIALATLVWTSVMQFCIQSYELKETAEALHPLGWKAGPIYLLMAYITAAMLLLVPLLLRRSYPAPDLLRIARALLVSFVGLLVLIAALSLLGSSRFLDSFKILLGPYIFPLMASAVVVLLWGFLRKQLSMGGASDG